MELAYCELTEEPLDLSKIVQTVVDPRHGGIVIFVGTVRNHNNGHAVISLEYETYPEMAVASIADIVKRCTASCAQLRMAVAHRYGHLAVGDMAVVIAASAPHREDAFRATRECIETIKKETPIWKKEFTPTGAEWVEVPAP
jgi:MoaE-MoaD fusion protein